MWPRCPVFLVGECLVAASLAWIERSVATARALVGGRADGRLRGGGEDPVEQHAGGNNRDGVDASALGRDSHGLLELLGESDEDPLGASHEAESVLVLILRDFVEELRSVPAEAGNDVVDVLDGEHDAA